MCLRKSQNHNCYSDKELKLLVIDIMKNEETLPDEADHSDELAVITGFFSNDFMDAIKNKNYSSYILTLERLVNLKSDTLNNLLVVDLFSDVKAEIIDADRVYELFDEKSKQLYRSIGK